MRQRSWQSLILILILGALCAVSLLNEHLVPAGDNATYMVLGQSLASGQGYRVISDPRRPAMALYPPGYAAVLAGVLLLTGNVQRLPSAVLPIKMISVVLFLASIGLTYGLFRRRDSKLAAVTALLMAVNPALLHFANELGTEMAYLFISLVCIWLFERELRRPSANGLLWTAGSLVAAFYVRSIALVVAGAFVARLLLVRRTREAAVLLGLVAVLVLPWFVYASSLPDTGTSVGLGRGYFALYFSSDPYGTEGATARTWLMRTSQNLRMYCLEIWPDVLFPHASRFARMLGSGGRLFLVAVFALLLGGFLLEARHRGSSELYFALFFASCVGYLWAQSRLIVPLIPFALYYLVKAIASVLSFGTAGRPRVRVAVFALACGGLTLSPLVADARKARDNVQYGMGQSVTTFYLQDSEWANYWEAARWIVAQMRPWAVVMCRKPDLFYVLIGDQALEYPYSTQGRQLVRAVYDNGVDYVIEDAFTWTRTTEQYLAPAIVDWRAQDPTALVMVYETAAPITRVWQVVN